MRIVEKFQNLRDKMLDYFFVLSCIITFTAGIILIIYAHFFLHITNFKPYLLYISMMTLAVMGFHYYKKEVEL